MINQSTNAINSEKALPECDPGSYNKEKSHNESFYRDARTRFLQQSADYLGLSLSRRQIETMYISSRAN